MPFTDDLDSIGFVEQAKGRAGIRHFALTGNRYLTYYVHVTDEQAGGVFSWEFALGEFCASRGLQVGANDVLNVFLYAAADVHVSPSVAAVVAQIDATDTLLNNLRLADPAL